MTARLLITAPHAAVNAALTTMLTAALQQLILSAESGASPRELELAVWEKLMLPMGRAVLEFLLALRCLRTAQAAGSEGPGMRYRLDSNYVLSQSTTLGVVHVPLFAYRSEKNATFVPSRSAVFPLHPKCRSSALLLEWEARTGAAMPFRQAEEALAFFTHGAATIEDTTIARHMGLVGTLIDPAWTCCSPEKRTEVLERATRDAETGRPLVYVSSDAHALRRYVDDTWNAGYKMINGIRIWAVDDKTGRTLQLGGAYTWGDCHETADLLGDLLERLEIGKGQAQFVFISDGMPWLKEYLVPILPDDAVVILDFYHLMEHLADYAAARWGKGSKASHIFLARAYRMLLGKRRYRRRKTVKRAGHKKRKRRRARYRVTPLDAPWGSGEGLLRHLIAEMPDSAELTSLLNYLLNNIDRTDYIAYRARNMQVGSGAMESFHRVASQMRLKLAGARWTAECALAVLNTRLLQLAGRWEEFWRQADLAKAFGADASTRPLGGDAHPVSAA